MTVKELNDFCKNTLIDRLGIVFTNISENCLEATMPVDERTTQPMKQLHGGAMLALAETLGSGGSLLMVDMNSHTVVGQNVHATHLKGVKGGIVKGVATIIHKGNRTHVWNIDIFDVENNLVSSARVTNMIIEL